MKNRKINSGELFMCSPSKRKKTKVTRTSQIEGCLLTGHLFGNDKLLSVWHSTYTGDNLPTPQSHSSSKKKNFKHKWILSVFSLNCKTYHSIHRYSNFFLTTNLTLLVHTHSREYIREYMEVRIS